MLRRKGKRYFAIIRYRGAMTFFSGETRAEYNHNQFCFVFCFRFEFTASVENGKKQQNWDDLALSLTPPRKYNIYFIIMIWLAFFFFCSLYIIFFSGVLNFFGVFFLLYFYSFIIYDPKQFLIVPLCSGDIAHWLNRSPSKPPIACNRALLHRYKIIIKSQAYIYIHSIKKIRWFIRLRL
jgi:hypothetical protein